MPDDITPGIKQIFRVLLNLSVHIFQVNFCSLSICMFLILFPLLKMFTRTLHEDTAQILGISGNSVHTHDAVCEDDEGRFQ